MSRTYDNNTANYASVGSAVVTAAPCTFAAWIRLAAINPGSQTVISAHNTISNFDRDCFMLLILSSGAVQALTANAAGPSGSTTAGTVTAGQWTHVAAVFASATSRIAYIGGAEATPETTSRIPSGINNLHVGVENHSTTSFRNPHNGEIGEAAVWSIALSAGEISSLASGACPNSVQTANIVSHWHIHGFDSPELDSIGSNDLTITGTLAKGDNPPRICVAKSLFAHRLIKMAGDLIGVPFNGSR